MSILGGNDEKKESWAKIEKGNFSTELSGIAASTGIVKQGDKVFDITKEHLERLAPRYIGAPFTLEHGGKQIGEITRMWVDDTLLRFIVGIFEGTTDEDIEKMNTILNESGGPSIVFDDDMVKS